MDKKHLIDEWNIQKLQYGGYAKYQKMPKTQEKIQPIKIISKCDELKIYNQIEDRKQNHRGSDVIPQGSTCWNMTDDRKPKKSGPKRPSSRNKQGGSP